MAETHPPALNRQRRTVLFIALLAGFITPFDNSGVNIALPTIGQAFHMDAILLSWVATAYLLSSVVFLVPFGKIADIHGRKRVFLLGTTIFTLSSALMTLVPTAGLLILVRTAQGIGASMIFGTAVAILTSVYPPGERGKVLGIYTTSVYLGLTLGPFLGGTLVTLFGWRSIFLINIPLGTIACILVLYRLKGTEWAECQGERLDIAGTVLYGAAMVLVMVGFSYLPDTRGMTLIIGGVIFTGLFIAIERQQQSPVLDLKLFSQSRIFAFSNLAALINYSATFAVGFLLSLDLQFTKGFSPDYAGLVLVASPLFQMAISPFAGRLSDHVNSQILASIGMGVSATGLLLLVFLQESTPLWFVLIALATIGLGFGIFASPNMSTIMNAVEKRYYGVASGIVNTMRLLGQMLSMGITMVIFALFIGRVEITPEYHPAFIASIHTAFLVFTVLCVIGIFASLARGKVVPASMKEKAG